MVPTMRATIVTTVCVFLGTLVVLSRGRGGSSSRRHTRSGDLAAELLRTAHDTSYDCDPSSKPCYTEPADTTFGYGCGNPASYDPREDFCFVDEDNPGKYCWFSDEKADPLRDHLLYPCGNWKEVALVERGYDCGRLCTQLMKFNMCLYAVYDPQKDFCFSDQDNPGKYCWCPQYKFPYGNWKLDQCRGFNECGFNNYGGMCTDCIQHTPY